MRQWKNVWICKKVVQEIKNKNIVFMGDEVKENGQKRNDFTEEEHLEILNVTIGVERETWSARVQMCAVDFMIVNGSARKHVTCMWVDKKRLVEITSDHNMLVMNYKSNQLSKKRVTNIIDCKRKRKLWDAK